jgi:hypothetical protein
VPQLSQSSEVKGSCDVFGVLVASISVSIRRRAGADQEEDGGKAMMTSRPAGQLCHPPFFVPLLIKGTVQLEQWTGVGWGRPAGQSGPVLPWQLVSPVWAAQTTLLAHGRPRTPVGAQAPPAGPDTLRAIAAGEAAPLTIVREGSMSPGGDCMVWYPIRPAGSDEKLADGETIPKVDAHLTLRRLLEEEMRRVEERDAELRARLPVPKRTGRKRIVYPPPYLGAAAMLYEMGYSYREVCDAVNAMVEMQYKMDEETLRNRFVEVGVKLRRQEEAVRMATLRGPRRPPRDTVQMAMAAALVQGDAAVRVKGRTMVEVVLNTPYEAYARTVAKIFEGHGTIALGARKFTENYYEWQLTIRLDLKDWRFLVECKKEMRIPDFVRTDEELRAYLATMLACEGYITWAAANKGRTVEPTTTFFVVPITNTNKQLINDINRVIKKRGYHTSVVPVNKPFERHMDRFGRLYESKLQEFRILIYRADEVYRILRWLGQIPHPLKECYRIWALRLLSISIDKPLRWSISKAIKERLDEISEKSLLVSRKRAERYFYERQQKRTAV